LEILLGAQGTVVSSEQLLERVWDNEANPFSQAVKTTVSRLRAKLGDPPVIDTVAKAGYRIGWSAAMSLRTPPRPSCSDDSAIQRPRFVLGWPCSTAGFSSSRALPCSWSLTRWSTPRSHPPAAASR
jgi:hypothetical protein